MPNTGASVRSTEGSRPGKRGRPKGSRNKSKGLIPYRVGQKLLGHMQEQLSPDQYDYLKGVVQDGRPIDTKNEIDTLITLLTRNLYPALIHEMMPEEEGGLGGIYRKDVTDRLKVIQGLLNLRHQKDKQDDPDSSKSDAILTITARRGFDLDRLGILIGKQPDHLDGSPDGTRGQTYEIGAVSDTVSERPLNLENSEQGETDRVLDSDSDGGGALVYDEDELQG